VLFRSVLRPPERDEDAWPRYRAVYTRVEPILGDGNAMQGLGKAAVAGPLVAVDPGAAAAVEAHRDVIAELRDALHANRATPELRLVTRTSAVPGLLAARTLGLMMVVDGHLAAASGDVAGAGERYLDTIRFGGDLTDGPLISSLIALAVADLGVRSLSQLLVSGRPLPFARIEKELALLESHRPSLASALREERLSMIGGVTRHETRVGDTFEAPLVFRAIVPYRFLVAQAAESADASWATLTAHGAPPFDRAPAPPGSRWNPALRIIWLSNNEGVSMSFVENETRFALCRAALALEQRAAAGRYPDRADALPADPSVPGRTSPLRYEQLGGGRGYRVSSAGDRPEAPAYQRLVLEHPDQNAIK